jgi:hypothetical protein
VGDDQRFVQLLQNSPMKCGSAMPLRFVPAMCGSKKRIVGMRNIFCSCWSKTLSAYLDTRAPSPAAHPSAQIGADTHAGQERTTASHVELGDAEKAEAVECGRPHRAPRSVETRSGRKNHEPAKTSFRAGGPRNAHESRKESAFKLRFFTNFLIQSADVVQGSKLKDQ